jgi:hypothetical protein
LLRKEEDSDRNAPLGIETGVQSAGFAGEEGGGKLREDTCAIAACAIGIHAATVREASERFESLFDGAVGRRATELSHEAHAAGVVLFSLVESTTPITVRIFRHVSRAVSTGAKERVPFCPADVKFVKSIVFMPTIIFVPAWT